MERSVRLGGLGGGPPCDQSRRILFVLLCLFEYWGSRVLPAPWVPWRPAHVAGTSTAQHKWQWLHMWC